MSSAYSSINSGLEKLSIMKIMGTVTKTRKKTKADLQRELEQTKERYNIAVDKLADAEMRLKERYDLAREPGIKKPLPFERQSITHSFDVAGHTGILTVGIYPDTGLPGEIFIIMPGMIGSMMDAWATIFSIALQHGVGLGLLCKKGKGHNIEPNGFSAHPDIGYVKSLMDYICRWLLLKFPSEETNT